MRTLFRNGSVYSPVGDRATAILVDESTIAWVGRLEPSEAGPAADVTADLDGALLAPAFVDAHAHATATGLTLTGLDLAGAATLREALDLVERYARAARGRPLLGTGWDETRWPEQRPPSAAELDRAGYGGVIYLSRVDVHSAVVSSALLAAVPTVRELPGYRADGWLTREAHDAARAVAFGALTPGRIREAQRATRRHAASLGIACLHEMAGPEVSSAEDLAGLLALARDEPGPEVVGYWGELFGIDAARELGAAGAGGDLFCDGSLGSHTAALRRPYADAPDTAGELRLGVAEVAEHVRRCAAAGLQAGFHAIGDAAVTTILDAVDRLAGTGHGPVGAEHRVEHAEMVPDPGRLARSGLTASMQPAFDAAWGGRDGMYARRLGASRAGGLNRFAELAAAGVPLAFGSDSPVTRLDPWGAVRAAAHPSAAAAGLSGPAAFAAHTRGGWRAGRADGDGSGVLAPGAPATFAVWRLGERPASARVGASVRWGNDPHGVPGLPDLRPGAETPVCVRTVLRGRTIYEATG